MAREDLVGIVPVVLADHLPQLLAQAPGVLESGVAVGALHRHHHVDAVRLAVDVLVDPPQLELELLGAEGERAEHAQSPGPAHRGGDVSAVGEGEDGELDAEHLAQAVLHRHTSGVEPVPGYVLG